MLGLGQQLHLAREAQGFTLRQVSAKIHIRVEYLEALEKEDWSTFADPIYVRGFLRTYAHFLELHAEEMVAQFNETAPVGIKLLGPDTRETPKHGAKRVAKRASIFLAFLILFSGMVFAGYAFLTHSSMLTLTPPNTETMLPVAAVLDPTPKPRVHVKRVLPTSTPPSTPTIGSPTPHVSAIPLSAPGATPSTLPAMVRKTIYPLATPALVAPTLAPPTLAPRTLVPPTLTPPTLSPPSLERPTLGPATPLP